MWKKIIPNMAFPSKDKKQTLVFVNFALLLGKCQDDISIPNKKIRWQGVT